MGEKRGCQRGTGGVLDAGRVKSVARLLERRRTVQKLELGRPLLRRDWRPAEELDLHVADEAVDNKHQLRSYYYGCGSLPNVEPV